MCGGCRVTVVPTAIEKSMVDRRRVSEYNMLLEVGMRVTLKIPDALINDLIIETGRNIENGPEKKIMNMRRKPDLDFSAEEMVWENGNF